MRQVMKIRIRTFATMLLSAALFMACAPVWNLEISSGEGVLLSSPMPVGFPFTTRYIHSVEKTPVEDDYRVVGGMIWAWEERVVSHNAGLPVVTPRNGRLVSDGEWFRFRGGRNRWGRFYYRVGDERLGRNILLLPGRSPVSHELFRFFPSQRMEFSIGTRPLWEAFSKARHL
ncbi:MAG: DUF1850 domain-containing protein [Thermovirgaceae bacterium]|nr:DUF1850 domain-containing protein [Thermovirgaceae bacterium]